MRNAKSNHPLPKVLLSKGAWRLLKAMEPEDAELTVERLQCWVDYERFHPRTVKQLLTYCLISQDQYTDGAYRIYTLNEEGRTLLADPEYRPVISKALVEIALRTDVHDRRKQRNRHNTELPALSTRLKGE